MEFEDGFGEGTVTDLINLQKALTMGYQDPPLTGGDALRVESLDGTLRVLSYLAQHMRLWNMIPQSDAFSTLEEYALLNSYGVDTGGFVDAGITPELSDSDYIRSNQRVKYVGTLRKVDHPATMVRTVPADLVAQETANGVMWMLGRIEWGLFFGDSSIIPQQWNGLLAQLLAGSAPVIDLRGASLSASNVEDAADGIFQNYGMPTTIFANSKVFADFSKLYFGQQRWNNPNPARGLAGTPLTGMSTQAGDISFTSDIFLKKGGPPLAAVSSTKAPSAPTLTPGTPAGTGSLFGTSDAGTYKYQVSAVNSYGESLPCAASANVTYTAGQSCTFTITDGGGTYPTTGYRIYRTDKSGSTSLMAFVRAIPRNSVSGVYQATTSFTDDNTYLQATSTAIMADMSPEALTFRKLSPLIKIPLAITSPAVSWMQLLYGTPIVFAPKRFVVFRNVG